MFEKIEKHPGRYLILFIIILLLIIPSTIAYLINISPINLTDGTENKDWLAFWATFGGNVIGLLGLALVTVYQDKKQQKYIQQQDDNQKEYISNQKVIEDNRLRIQLIRESVYSNMDNILSLKKSVISIIEEIFNDIDHAAYHRIGFNISDYNNQIFEMLTKISEINILLQTNDKYLSIPKDNGFSLIIDNIRNVLINANEVEPINPNEDMFESGSYLEMYEKLSDIHSSKFKIHDHIMLKHRQYHEALAEGIIDLKLK